MKTNPPKMTEREKAQQNAGSRFTRTIPAHKYAEYIEWRSTRAGAYQYDSQGRRIR